jgi:hypothetical protein
MAKAAREEFNAIDFTVGSDDSTKKC